MAKLGRESKPLPPQLTDSEILAGTDTSDRLVSSADLKLAAMTHGSGDSGSGLGAHLADESNPHHVQINQIPDGDDLVLIFENNLV